MPLISPARRLNTAKVSPWHPIDKSVTLAMVCCDYYFSTNSTILTDHGQKYTIGSYDAPAPGSRLELPSLRDITQDQAVRAFCRLGGEERRGKGSHKVVNFGRWNLSIPHGILKVGLLRSLIRTAGVTEDEFLDAL